MNDNLYPTLTSLADEIARGRAIVYVGAGVAASAKLPAWNDLLQELRNHAEPTIARESVDSRAYFDKCFKKEKNLEVADWLQDILDKELGKLLHQLLTRGKDGVSRKPSRLHHDIARIRFNMVLTTNYDNLLETALAEAGRKPDVFDWRDVRPIVNLVGDPERFLFIKTHGDCRNPDSVVLTGRQYKGVMHENKRFIELLKWIFISRTCVFVGASLEDPDLIYLFHEAVSQYGDMFGPHYALIPPNEAPSRRVDLLMKSLRIKLIPLQINDAVVAQAQKSGEDIRAIAASHLLTALSGEAALKQLSFASVSLPTSDQKGFYLRASLQKLINLACEWTGSFRGDICLPPEGPGLHFSGRLVFWVSSERTNRHVRTHPDVPANSICGIAYYKATSAKGIYLKNVDEMEIDPESGLNLYGDMEYQEGWAGMKSELAIPIEADGVRVGVLNLESQLSDAYSEGHIGVAQRLAEKAGRLYSATDNFTKRGSRLESSLIEASYSVLQDLFHQLRMLCGRGSPKEDLAFFVYQVDYREGRLTPQDPSTTILKSTGLRCAASSFRFEDQPSLVATVFSSGRPKVFASAEDAIKMGQISGEFDPQLRVRGAILAFPVLIHGHIAGVVEAWDMNGRTGGFDSRDLELLRRASHLLANANNAAEGRGLHEVALQSRAGSPNVVFAKGVVGLFRPVADLNNLSQSEFLSNDGVRWASSLSSVLKKFLYLLQNKEDQFRSEHKFDSVQQGWMWIKRCRFWLRVKGSDSKTPRFVIALQVSLDSSEQDRDIFSFENEGSS